MKLIKAIKLHRKLRIRQEIIFNDCVLWSQIQYGKNNYEPFPNLNEYSSINRAVRKVEDKLPYLYFFISDVFGYSEDLKVKVRFQDDLFYK